MKHTPLRVLGIGALTAAIAVLPLASGQAAPQVRLDQTKKSYIVQLAAEPLATYDGGVAGIPATAPTEGHKVDTEAENSRAYRSHLRNEQRRAMRAARVADNAKKHEYTVAFNGFAASLTPNEAEQLKKTKEVVNVWEDETRYADTVTTPDYLGLTGRKGVWQEEFGKGGRRDKGTPANEAGKGMVIGVLDTGIDPNNPSFAPLGGRVSVPEGFTCDKGEDPSFACNNKLIGARFYGADFGNITSYDVVSPRDTNGHGSHTAGTAAGNHDVPMSILGIDMGRGSGMAPGAQIATYKALWQTADGRGTGTTQGLVAAIDDAVADGVDVINYSVSGSSQYIVGADEIAFFHAAQAGVFVSTSAGNSGDTVGESSVAHNAPWTMTVAASTHNRGVSSTLTTGDGRTYTGVGFGGPLPATPMVRARDIPAAGATPDAADLCGLGTVDDAGAAGKVVVCTRGTHALVDKGKEVRDSGAAGMVMVNVAGGGTSLNAIVYGLPAIHLNATDGAAVMAHAATPGATGAISASKNIEVDAPAMGSFSSYGPALAGNGDLLKPDITAPGVDVIAAYSQDPDSKEPRFESLQGTSMSAPHIAGLAALVKQKNPRWSPMAIKSALMTTARQTTDAGKPIPAPDGSPATPLNYGSGEVVPAASFDPGLVYDSTSTEWLSYACAIGQLQLIGQNVMCDLLPKLDPSDLNTPSIAIGQLAGKQTITRTVTNVSGSTMTYKATVEAPPGTKVEVSPSRLTVRSGQTATFRVTITRTSAALDQYAFGALTWEPNKRKASPVRSPIAVKPVGAAAPEEVRGAGASGSADLTVTPGFTGTLGTDVDGLIASTVTPLNVTRNPSTPLDGYTIFEVAPGTKVTRVSTFSEEVTAADIDLTLYRFNEDGTISGFASSGTEASTEEVTLRDLEPGRYVAGIDVYSPEATASVPVHVWNLGDATEGNLTAEPSSAHVVAGQDVTVKAVWTGLEGGKRYLGQVNLLEGTTPARSTLVMVNA